MINGLDKFPFGIGAGKPIPQVFLGKFPFQPGVCLRRFRMAVQIVTETDTSPEVRRLLPPRHKQMPAAVRVPQPTVVVSRTLHGLGIHDVKGFYDNGYVQDRLRPDAVDGGTAEMPNIHRRFVPELLDSRPDC